MVRFHPGEQTRRSAHLLALAGVAPDSATVPVAVPIGELAARLDAVRAAEQSAGIAHECGHVGCHGAASSRVRGVWLCAGHAGFAAVAL